MKDPTKLPAHKRPAYLARPPTVLSNEWTFEQKVRSAQNQSLNSRKAVKVTLPLAPWIKK